jgi:predicted Fe-S protein YdhL (DUF1289 family)
MGCDGEISSPCINVCQLDADRICSGCGRHIDEIAAWRLLDSAARRAVIARAELRRKDILSSEKN